MCQPIEEMAAWQMSVRAEIRDSGTVNELACQDERRWHGD